jgi:hypothetical protein
MWDAQPRQRRFRLFVPRRILSDGSQAHAVAEFAGRMRGPAEKEPERAWIPGGIGFLGVTAAAGYGKPWIAFARQKFIGSGFDERSDHLQQGLLLGTISSGEEVAQFDVRDLSAGWNIRLMQDEHSARGIFAQMPAISIWAAVELSRSRRIHGLCSTGTTLVGGPMFRPPGPHAGPR